MSSHQPSAESLHTPRSALVGLLRRVLGVQAEGGCLANDIVQRRRGVWCYRRRFVSDAVPKLRAGARVRPKVRADSLVDSKRKRVDG